MLKVTTLPSGFRIATYKIDRQAVAMAFNFRVGWRTESPEQVGVSHFLEHILLKGSTKYPTPQAVRDSVESLGGGINASTGMEDTDFYSRILLDHADQAFDTLADALQAPLLDPKRIDSERLVIREELNKYYDDPKKRLSYLIRDVLWSGHPMAYPLEEQENNLKIVSKEKLLSYMEKNFTYKNCVFLIVGNVEHQAWVEKIAESISGLREGSIEKIVPARKISGIKVSSYTMPTKQTQLAVSFYAPSYHDNDYFSYQVASEILDRRLFFSLRYDKSLAYSAGFGSSHYDDSGYGNASGGFRSGNVKEVVQTILTEVKNLQDKLADANELEAAKARIKSGVAFGNENVMALLNTYSHRILKDIKPLLLEDKIKLYDKVSLKEVSSVANKYFDENYKISMVGPEEEVKTLENLYGQKKS